MITIATTIKKWTSGAMFAILVGGSLITAVAPITVSAAAYTCAGAKPFLTFPVWYRGLNVSASDCTIRSPEGLNTSPSGQPSNGLSNFIWLIVLNVIEIGLQLVGYIAVGYILYGGFLFLTSTGSSDGMTKARTTIQNAVIGLVISIASVGIVNLIMGVIG